MQYDVIYMPLFNAESAACLVLSNLDGIQSSDNHLDFTQTCTREDCHGMNSCPFSAAVNP